ncbi:MAG: M20/M25/M40 family metallo-hydrolase [Anaerolineae bacterium]|nr:M20/M25/M40 family metallo-hydrolase [Anaerolineae bacterium]
MDAHSLLSHLHADEPVDLAQQMIRIPSFLWRESELAYWLADWMRERNFEVELQEVPLAGGGCTHQAIGILRGDGSGPSLMLCGHTDTSDWQGGVFRRADWRHDPFAGEIEDGMLYGLGAINMKGGLAAVLMAAETLRRSALPLRGDLIVACVVAETGGGAGAQHLLASGLRTDYCIVTEAGNLDVGLISVGYVQGLVKVVGEFKHRVPYVNPIEKITKVLEAFGPSYHPLPSVEAGGWLRFETHPLLPGFPAMAVRDISHHQDVTTLAFDLRIVPGMSEESVRADMSGLLEGIRQKDVDFRYELVIPQSERHQSMPAREATDPDLPLVQALFAAHARINGREPAVGAGHRIGATADTCHFKGAGIACVEYGPGYIPVWPMVDECIAVDQIVSATRTLALTAATLCTGRSHNE